MTLKKKVEKRYCKVCGNPENRIVEVYSSSFDFDNKTGKRRTYLACSNPECSEGSCRVYGIQGHKASFWRGNYCKCGVDILSKY